MPKELEVEFKNLLSKSEFDLLFPFFNISNDDFFIQENIYFDTPYLTLKSYHSAFRVRVKDKTYQLTIKEPHQKGLMETNQFITHQEYKQLINNYQVPDGEVKSHLIKLLPTLDLVEIAHITTKRAQVPYQNQILFFDISTYDNVTDYELELETDDYKTGEAVFNALLEQFSIPQRIAPPKVKRAYDYRMQQKRPNNN